MIIIPVFHIPIEQTSKVIIATLILLGLRMCAAFVPHQHHLPKRVASASKSITQANLFPKKERDPSIALTDEQDQALRAVAKDFDVLYGPRWFDDGEAWEKARSQYGVLDGYSDEELRTAFIRQGPRLVDVLTETPLGPFILINLLA